MKRITVSKVFIYLILLILPCNAIASEKLAPVPHSMRDKQGPEIFVKMDIIEVK